MINREFLKKALIVFIILFSIWLMFQWSLLILSMEDKKNFHPEKFEYNKGKNYFPKTN